MPADVIKVDFEARRLDSMSASELVDEAIESLRDFDGFSTEIRDIARQVTWLDGQRSAERHRAISLQHALDRERSRNFPFTDTDVLAALRAEYDGRSVSATAVAMRLDGREPTHSGRVRAGLALSRLAAAGLARVAQAPTGHEQTRWAPVEVDDA